MELCRCSSMVTGLFGRLRVKLRGKICDTQGIMAGPRHTIPFMAFRECIKAA
jgi:hypothetical protein